MKNIIILIFVCLFIPSLSSAYVDLDSSHLAYQDIEQLKAIDVALGYPDNTFRPDAYITEEELITILLRGANLDVCKDFKSWPSDYIELALNNGIVADESTVTGLEFIEFIKKMSILTAINDSNSCFTNRLNGKYYTLGQVNKETEYMTRAEACMYINKIINNDGKISEMDLPQEAKVYYSDEELNVATIIKSVKAFEYDTYNGEYANIINFLKTGKHPYLTGRNRNAQGNYIIAIEFDTINNSEYGVWTSYKSLKFEGLQILDAFDLDEIEKQLENCAYDATLIKSSESYIVTAFYIVDSLPEELKINRDITTLYNLQTHEYVDCNYFSTISIKL